MSISIVDNYHAIAKRMAELKKPAVTDVPDIDLVYATTAETVFWTGHVFVPISDPA